MHLACTLPVRWTDLCCWDLSDDVAVLPSCFIFAYARVIGRLTGNIHSGNASVGNALLDVSAATCTAGESLTVVDASIANVSPRSALFMAPILETRCGVFG